MPAHPTVDVNLLACNAVETAGAAIDSVLRQTWPAISLSLIDDGSTDGTGELLADYAARDPRIRLIRRRARTGMPASVQHALRHGDAAFVMLKNAEDLIAPEFVARTIRVLLADPGCAMCHAAGLVFAGAGEVQGRYPAEHCLNAAGPDPVARARHVMQRYTSPPSFWGVYRRSAADRLSPIRHAGGWDHVLLAELALFGDLRHIPEPLYWHRDGCKPARELAREASAQAASGLPISDPLGDPRWRMPLISTAFAHVETFATARLGLADRRALIAEVAPVFRSRWLSRMTDEAIALGNALPSLIAAAHAEDEMAASVACGRLLAAIQAATALVPEVDLAPYRAELTEAGHIPARLAA